MARLALTQHGADWVIHNDADEFWWPLVGSLRDVFAAIPREYGQIEVQRHNFLPRPDGPGSFYSRLVYREPESLNPSGRRLEPKVAHRPHTDVVVAPGNHWISGGALRPAPAAELLEIFHYPMRSYDQFERKVIQIGIGYEKLEHRSPEVGRDQLKLLQICRADALRDYYDNAILEDPTIQHGLEAGSIVLDRRLETFMQSLSELAAAGRRPDGPPSRALITRTLTAALDADAAQRASEHAQAELAVTEAELAEARAENSALARKLAATQTWAGSLVNLLGVMGGRSILRRSARLRRQWHRVKRRWGRL
jgi:hypothetical protein